MTNRHDLILLDLQLFAEDDEDEEVVLEDLQEDEGEEDEEDAGKPGGEEGTDEEDESEGEDTGDEEDEEDEESGEDKDPKDSAIIKNKREKKRYKKEAEEARRKYEELQASLQAKEQAEQEETRKQEMIKEGYSQEDAAKLAKLQTERDQFKKQLDELRFRDLERRYPGISSYKDQIVELRDKLPEDSGMTESEIYLAKFAKNSQFDAKTQAEQEMLYKQKQGKEKSKVEGTPRTEDPVKLPEVDEKAYQLLKKQDPSWTRKKYKELATD